MKSLLKSQITFSDAKTHDAAFRTTVCEGYQLLAEVLGLHYCNAQITVSIGDMPDYDYVCSVTGADMSGCTVAESHDKADIYIFPDYHLLVDGTREQLSNLFLILAHEMVHARQLFHEEPFSEAQAYKLDKHLLTLVQCAVIATHYPIRVSTDNVS
jgi:hypothetical protein